MESTLNVQKLLRDQNVLDIVPLLEQVSNRRKNQNGKVGAIGASFQHMGAIYYSSISQKYGVCRLLRREPMDPSSW